MPCHALPSTHPDFDELAGCIKLGVRALELAFVEELHTCRRGGGAAPSFQGVGGAEEATKAAKPVEMAAGSPRVFVRGATSLSGGPEHRP